MSSFTTWDQTCSGGGRGGAYSYVVHLNLMFFVNYHVKTQIFFFFSTRVSRNIPGNYLNGLGYFETVDLFVNLMNEGREGSDLCHHTSPDLMTP